MCQSLTSITIPNSVSEIGWHAFSNCKSLTSVAIPNSITKIDIGTFEGCTNLKSVEIPNSVTCIGYQAFSGCNSILSVKIPSSVVSELNVAFDNNCTIIKEIKGPNDSVYYIVKENGLWGLKKATTNSYIVQPELEALEAAGVGFLRFKLNGFYGIVNYAGKIIIPTDRGYTKIGDYVSFTKRFAYEMDGWKGECNNLTQIKPEEVVPNKPEKKDTIVIKHDPIPVQVWKQCDICFGSGTCQACANIVWGRGSDRRCYGCGWSRKCQFCAGQGGHYEVEYR